MRREITIIGGNVAGLAAAFYLSRKGFSPIVYEEKIWNKPCGGAISLEFEHYLKRTLEIELKESDHYTERFKVGLWDGRFMEDKGVFRTITRLDLQKKLVERLKNEPNITFIEKRVRSYDYDIFTPQTIVATGYSGFTRRIMNRKWSYNERALTLRYDGNFPKATYPNANLIALHQKIIGYGWVFVGKGTHINVGVGGVASKDYIKSMYNEFFTVIKNKFGYNMDPPKNKPESWILPLPTKKPYKQISIIKAGIEFIGVGDVLGLAHSLSGAGIEPAWQSGWVLASSINQRDKTINVEKFRSLLSKNLRLTSWRRLDQFASTIGRKNLPFKSTVGFFALQIIRHRMINMMRKYPWFALVHDGKKKTGFRININSVIS